MVMEIMMAPSVAIPVEIGGGAVQVQLKLILRVDGNDNHIKEQI